MSPTSVGWDEAFQDKTGMVTKQKDECEVEPLSYNQNHVIIAIDI